MSALRQSSRGPVKRDPGGVGPGSVRLRVRVHPGARRPGLVGRLSDGSIKVAVAEPPEGGRANRAVEEALAAALGLARSQVKVVGGAAARQKQVEVVGLDAPEAERRLAAVLGGAGSERRRGADDGE